MTTRQLSVEQSSVASPSVINAPVSRAMREEPDRERSFSEIGVIGQVGVRPSSTRLARRIPSESDARPDADFADYADFAEALGSAELVIPRPN